MTIDVVQLKNDISKVIGDQQNQYTLERDLEIKNSIIELTTNYTFYWNIERVTGLTHTNGKITLPTGACKILQLYDSDGNSTYTSSPQALFWLRHDGFYEQGVGNRGLETPFIRGLNKNDGTEYLQISTGVDTSSSLTFSMVYTISYNEVLSWLPDRLYPYILGKVVYTLLNRVDNPDSQLLQVYSGMFKDALKNELNFSQNADFNEYNQKVVNNLRAIKIDSKGV